PPLIMPALLLFWVPLLDASYRAFKRFSRGVSLMTAGHDSLADTLQQRISAPRRVALLVGSAQGLCSSLGIGVIESGVDSDIAAIPVAASFFIVSVASVASTRAVIAPAPSRK